jgi:hypothetical protein
MMASQKRQDACGAASSPGVNAVAAQANIKCTLTIEEVVPEKSCRQTLEGTAEFSVPILGRLVERVVAESLKNVYAGIPPIAAKCAAHALEPHLAHSCFLHAPGQVLLWSLGHWSRGLHSTKALMSRH